MEVSHTSRRNRVDFIKGLTYQPYGARPIGACEIDRLVSEYVEKNIFSVRWEASQIRNTVEEWFSEAVVMARDMLIRWPGERQNLTRLLDDLLLIHKLLERNKELLVQQDLVMNKLSTKNSLAHPFNEQWKSKVRNLLIDLNRVSADISFVIESSTIPWETIEFAPPKRNFDPLTFFFIEYEHELWCDLRPLQGKGCRLPRRDVRPFARFLSAIWRDLRLPSEDHLGRSREPLEDWFADRLRKHFEGHWVEDV
jgi:hypothetical protein